MASEIITNIHICLVRTDCKSSNNLWSAINRKQIIHILPNRRKKNVLRILSFWKANNRKLFIAEYCRNRRTLDVRSKIDQSNTKCFMIFVSFSFDFPKTTFSESKFNNQIFVVGFFWLKCRFGWCVVIKSFHVAITLKNWC